jgi:hypothetical protein
MNMRNRAQLLAEAPRPWVVCDWGAIRTHSRGTPVAAECSFVLCDTLFLEPADAEQSVRKQMVEKLRAFLETPGVIDRGSALHKNLKR